MEKKIKTKSADSKEYKNYKKKRMAHCILEKSLDLQTLSHQFF